MQACEHGGACALGRQTLGGEGNPTAYGGWRKGRRGTLMRSRLNFSLCIVLLGVAAGARAQQVSDQRAPTITAKVNVVSLLAMVHDRDGKVVKNLTRRKAFVLLTDGVAFREPTSIGSAIEFAQRADVIIYSIRFSDNGGPLSYLPTNLAIVMAAKEHGKHELHRMAEETGGVSYGSRKASRLR